MMKERVEYTAARLSVPSRAFRSCAVAVLLVFSVILSGSPGHGEVYDPEAAVRNVFDDQRLRLTAEYCRTHYGVDSWRLKEPKMIVVHYTAFATLEESYRFFAPVRLDPLLRKDIRGGGQVNVSAHYLVDHDGALIQMAPDDVVCRHTIGFNHTAIGIENVGRSAADLTEAQASTTADIVSRLVARHPSISYLIGHDQYRDPALPHHRLFREDDPGYRLTAKIDPGRAFMARVRVLLRERYGLALQE